MRIVRIKSGGSESAAIEISSGFVRLDVLNEEKRTAWPEDFEELVYGGEGAALARWYEAGGETLLENISRRFVVPREKAEITGGPSDVGGGVQRNFG